MYLIRSIIFIALISLLVLWSANAFAEAEMSGNLTSEFRYFYKSPTRKYQESDNLSVAAEPELYYRLPDSRDSFTFTPFFRLDENDSKRSHLDIRELFFHKVMPQWELKVGINTVFWGVTETVHLVNIINQIDMVENPDGEDLLGQPMVNLSIIENWGTVNLFILPGFRERTFPGRDGRPGTKILIDNDETIYESGAKENHVDFALRWSHSFDIWDVGISHFSGTSREPRFDPSVFSVNSNGEAELIPIYEIIDQTGIDIQSTFEAWLLKLEAIVRSGQDKRFFAFATGFEYTFFDVAASGVDFGVISEYLYNERKTEAMDNDLALGMRLSFNDIQSTEILAALIHDLENRSQYFYLEAQRRIGNSFKLSIEMRGVSNVENNDPLSSIEADEFVQIEFGYYF
ncbi:MAG: hypothetical protein ABIK92_17975 [Pseudomonadota bacterium]